MHVQRSPGVHEMPKQKQEHESITQKSLSQLGTEVTRKDNTGPMTESQGVSLCENCSLSHREKGFSSPQFLLEMKLELCIKPSSVSSPVPLCQLRVTHPLDLSSSTTSSRKFSLTSPPRSDLLFYVYKTISSSQHFSLLWFCIDLPDCLTQISYSLEWTLPKGRKCLVLQLFISLHLACHTGNA